MAEKSRKLRITREAQGTSWMKMALNLVIMMTIGQDDGGGTNISIMVTGTFPFTEVSNGMAEGADQ